MKHQTTEVATEQRPGNSTDPKASMRNALILLAMSFKSPYYRLRHDLGRELVVMVSSLIFVGTFLYVFEDFLNVQVAALSPKLRWWIAATLQGLLAAGASFATGLHLAKQKVDRDKSTGTDVTNIQTMARFLGEIDQNLKVHQLLWTLCLSLFAIVSVLAASQRWLVALPLAGLLGTALAMAVVIGLIGAFADKARVLLRRSKATHSEFAVTKGNATGQLASPNIVLAMTQFRLKQIYGGKPQLRWGVRASQLLLALSAPACLGLTNSIFLAGFGGLLAGLILAAWFAVFLAEDLSQIWLERSAGIHHNDYIETLETLTRRLALWPLVVSLGTILAMQLFAFKSAAPTEPGDFQLAQVLVSSVQASLQASVPGVLAILLIPWTALQIDGRKPAIPAMTVTILALFIGSAILAHPLALVLIPLVRSFGMTYQQGRFYRC